MPSLAELTDQYPQQDNSLPVAQPYTGGNLGPLQGSNSGIVGNTTAIVPEPVNNFVAQADPNSVGTSTSGSQIIDKLLGLGGQERYQLWPEKVIRDAISAPHDIMQANPYPEGSEEAGYYEDLRNKSMVPAALNMSALAGTGGLAGTGAEVGEALGSSPFLRPALKYEGKIYKAPVGGQHLDALPANLADTFQKQAMSGEDISNFNFGFMNHKGQFLNREAALDYAVKEGLVDPHAGQYGALTSTLLADSSKPGTAIEAMAKTGQPFYSALEHNINAIQQPKMTGDQWLGTLSNKPGVKPEELDWTGVKDFLKEKGNQPVTKAELQEHLQNNKVELKEVNKFQEPSAEAQKAFDAHEKNVDAIYDKLDAQVKKEFGGTSFKLNNGDKIYSDELSHGLFSGDIKPSDVPTSLQPIAKELAEGFKAREAARDDLKASYKDTNKSKYHSYQLPGGENYREKLLTLPDKQQRNYEYEWYDPATNKSKQFKTEAEAKADAPQGAVVNPKEISTSNEAYRSSHWDEPNILAHVRMNDRIIDGKKSLGINEAQSDWHQQGRAKGYRKPPPKLEEVQKLKDIARNKELEYGKLISKVSDETGVTGPDLFKDKRLMDAHVIRDWLVAKHAAENLELDRGGHSAVPNAPFKKSWHELVLKRMIREAAEKGYDNLHFPGSPETVAKVEGWGDFKTKIVDGEKRYFTGTQDVTPIVNRYLVDFPRFLNKIGKEHGVKVNSLEIPGKLSNKMGEPPETIKLNHIDIPESLKNTALGKGFPLFSSTHIFTPVSHNPFAPNEKKK